jgi:hypothetical protein
LMIQISFSQVKVQVVTQEVTRKIEWKTGMSVMLSGENAEIVCTSHPENTIDIYLTIISKHTDRSIAETDLQKMKWLVEEKDNKCYIRNYIELTRNEALPESAIRVICNVQVPDGCPVDVRNYFGKTDISGLKSGLSVHNDYGPVSLSGVICNVTVNSVFGDITVTGAIGTTSISSSHSLIKFSLDSPDQYRFHLELTGTEIIKPEEFFIVYDKNEKGKISGNINGKSTTSLVSLNLTNCSLTIE